MAESDSRSTNILSELIIMLVIAIVAIFLRFWSRIVAHSSASSSVRLWWDDWLALATLPFLIVFYSINIYWVGIGLGKHAADIPPQDVERGVILLGIDYIFFDTAISLPKLSALLFYARVFTVRGSPGSKVLRAFLWLAGALVVSWWIAAVVTSITQCMPLSKAWDPATPGHCFDIWTWWLTTAIFSTLIDLFILVIPLPSLWKLQLRPAKKVLITVVFICGYGVVVASIGRLVAIIDAGSTLNEDFTYNIVPVAYWIALEGSLSMLCICLPSMFSLIKRGVQRGPWSLFTSKDVPKTSTAGSRSWFLNKAKSHYSSSDRDFSEGLTESQNETYTTRVSAHRQSSRPSSQDRETLGIDVIRMQRGYDVIVEH